ncbi:Zinc finger SWIM domain-containing protein 7 [Trichinella sp. T6]|nr:Zinc finger SWIM domain-containing protein 7 [Trichinella sp. T6]
METTVSWRCIVERLLDELQARYQSDGMIADEIMLAMSAVFDSQTVLESFNLVDRNSICRLVSSSGKILFQVVDEDDTAWLVLPKVNYCKCEFFANEVLYGHFQICKHVLAVWLASAVGRLHHLCGKFLLTQFIHLHNEYFNISNNNIIADDMNEPNRMLEIN